MRRSIRTLLGVTAAAGIVALGVPALATSASASTADSSSTTTEFRHYGPYLSANYKAKIKGAAIVKWDPYRKSNKVNVKGELHDLDYRTFKHGGKCAYVSFKIHHLGNPGFKWKQGPTYRWCGADKAPRHVDFWDSHVDGVKAQVCQIGKFSHYPTRCGDYKPVYLPHL